MSYDIESLQNAQIKHVIKLRENRERKRTGQTRIDGGRELLRALQSGVDVDVVYHCPPRVRAEGSSEALELARERGIPMRSINEAVYDKLRFGDRDEGICATLHWSPGDATELTQLPKPSLVLVVEGVEKPGNLGALLRTADGVGCDAVVCVDPACEIDGPNVIRASMGALFAQRVFQVSTQQALAWLRQSDLRTVITRPEAERPYWDQDLRAPTALVMGAEHAGLSGVWDDIDADAVHLPMNGVSDSLNLSVATAVLLYEALRQRTAGVRN